MKYPRFIRTKTLPDINGICRHEWLVRGISDEMVDQHGVKTKTPDDLLNRYFRSDTTVPFSLSVTHGQPGCFVRYEDVKKDIDFVEYT